MTKGIDQCFTKSTRIIGRMEIRNIPHFHLFACIPSIESGVKFFKRGKQRKMKGTHLL